MTAACYVPRPLAGGKHNAWQMTSTDSTAGPPLTSFPVLLDLRQAVHAVALVLGVAIAVPVGAQPVEPTWTQRALSAINASSPVGMVPAEQRRSGISGWFGDAWEGGKRILRDGRTDFLLPMYSWHPAFAYPNRDAQNHYSWGAGVARTLIDERDNERIVYALAFSDSHYDLQVTAGYGWLARWPLFAGLKGGLGYTVFVAARSDANYIPFPGILPIAGIGTDRVMFYGSWIPFSDVLFVFARISLPVGEAGTALFEAAGGARRNLIYGAGAYVNTDASGIDTVSSGNGSAPMLGYRRYLSDSVALDVSAWRANFTLDWNGARLGSFDFTPVTFALQYHLPSYRGLRMYAGLGAAYNRVSNPQMPGYALERTHFAPVVQAGVDFAVSESVVITAGLGANFSRNRLTQNGAGLGTVQLSPVAFSLGIGLAF